MANREKGEVSLTIGGRVLTLVLNTNAMAEIEEQLSTPDKERNWDYFAARMTNPKVAGVRELRLLFWGMTREHHPELSMKDVGVLIDEAGGVGGLMQLLVPSAVTAATPDQADVEAIGLKPSNPPAAPARKKTAGGGSTSTPAPPD